MRRIVSLSLAIFLLLGLIGNYTPQAKAYSPNSQEVTDAPNYPIHIYSDGSYLFIGTMNGTVYRSADNAATWTQILNVGSTTKICYLLEKDAQGNLYTSFTDHKLRRSTDNGDSWTVVYDLSAVDSDLRGYSTTGGFFDMENGTILSARRDTDSPVIDRSDDWGVNWSVWKNFSEIFPAYTQADPNNPSVQMQRHTHITYYFNNTYYVSIGDYSINHYKSTDGGATWIVDKAGDTFTSVKVLDDRVILGMDMGDHTMFVYKNGKYIKTYNPNRDVQPYNIFKTIAYDSENDIYYTCVMYGEHAPQLIIASLDKGDSWFDFISRNASSGFYGQMQVEVHKNYLWYVTGDKAFKVPKPSQAEIINVLTNDATTFTAYENVKTFTSLTQKAYRDVTVTLSNTSLENQCTNPSFESFTGSNPTNWTFYSGQFDGLASRGEETSDVYHGSKAYYVEAINGSGSINTYTDTFTTTEGHHYLTVMFKVNASYLRASVKLQLYCGGNEDAYQASIYLHNVSDVWRPIGRQFYLTSAQAGSGSKIYVIVEGHTSENITVRVLWDAISLVKAKEYDHADRHTYQAFINTGISSQSGSILLNGETYQVTTLPKTISLEVLTGLVSVNLTSMKIVNVTITGTEVVNVSNASLINFQNDVYLARWHSGFAVTMSNDGKLILFQDEISLATSYSYASDKLIFTISAPSETTSTTKIYSGDKGQPTAVHATNGTLTWSYNPSTKILTLNVVHAGPTNILVNWRIPGDVNGDGDIDGSDLFDLSKAYGSKPGDLNYNPNCDLNWDSKVGVSDLLELSKNYGKTKT